MHSEKTKASRLSKCIVSAFILFAIALALGLAAAPSALSTAWGKKQLLAFLNHQISGKLAIDTLDLGWWGPQTLRGVRLLDDQGTQILSIEKATSASSLFALINNSAADHFSIENLNLDLTSDLAGSTNLARALRKCCQPKLVTAKQLPIALKNVSANINLADAAAPLWVQMHGATQQGSSQGTFKIEVASNRLSAQELLTMQRPLGTLFSSPEGGGLQLNAEVSNFPMSIIDQIITYRFPELAGWVLQAIGEQLNISLKQAGTETGSALHFAAHSSNLDLIATAALSSESVRVNIDSKDLHISDLILQQADGRISLAQPVTASLRIPAQLLDRWLPAPIKIEKISAATLRLNELSVPASLKEAMEIGKIDAQAQVVLTDVAISGLPSVPELNLSHIQVDLQAAPLGRIACALKTSFASPSASNQFVQLVGQHGELHARGIIDLQSYFRPWLERAHLDISTDLLQATVEGEMVDEKMFFFTAPLAINYRITQEFLSAIGVQPDKLILVEPQLLKLTIAPTQFAIHHWNPAHWHLAGQLLLPQLQFNPQNGTTSPALALRDLSGRWIFDGALGQIKTEFSGRTLLGQNQAEGSVSGVLALDHLLAGKEFTLDQAKVKGHLKLHHFPTELASNLAGNDQLVPLVGVALDASVELELLLPVYKGAFNVKVESERLYGEARFLLDNSLTLDKDQPAQLRWQLTPSSYNALRQLFGQETPPTFILDSASLATLKFSSFHLPFSHPDWKRKLLSSSFTADLAIDQLVGFDKKKTHKISLENIHGRLNSSHLSQQIDYQVGGKGSSNLHGKTSWEVTGTLNEGFLADSSLNREALSLNLVGTVKALPVALFTELCCLDKEHGQKIEAVFGPTLDGKVTARLQQMNGPVTVDLQGHRAHCFLDATIDNGVATLNKDLTIQVKVTPELGRTVFQELLPIMDGIMSSDQPLKITVPHKGVLLPIQPFSLSEIVIPRISLELGKVTFSSASQFAKALSLLVLPRDQFQVWITPSYLSVKNGSIYLSRVDLLINDRYPLAAWGTVELVKEKVNMVIGLTGKALSQAFSLSEIPNNYMLQLPLKGSLKNPGIDKTKATARISSLVAQSRGGPQGAVLGAVLDIASGSLAEGGAPEPTTNPLPWADLLKPEADPKKETPADNSSEVNDVMKGAESIIKKIFK